MRYTPQQGFNTVTTTTAPTTGSFHTHVTDLILRVGLNYRFGGPIVATAFDPERTAKSSGRECLQEARNGSSRMSD
jgi:hypothetical protein